MQGGNETRSTRRTGRLFEFGVFGCSLLLAALSSGCRDDDDGDLGSHDTGGCIGAKCDDPQDATGTEGETDAQSETDGGEEDVGAACEARRTDAFNPNRLGFIQDALRWSCADVPGRPPDERGQEYCEYFAIVQVPYDPEPHVLGMLLGPDFSDGHTPVSLELATDQIEALESNPDEIVGACVFTSWNSDIEGPLDHDDRDIFGVAFDDEVFRMKHDPNSNEAAQALVEDCLEFIPPHGDFTDPDDPLHDPFLRACHLVAELEGTQDRKSDTIICGGTVRLAECGCSIEGGTALPVGLAPADVLGFPLGGWDGPDVLPPGCRFEALVPDSQNVVVCDLTAAQVVQNASELKAYCQDVFADDVVVHVPVPASLVVCDPDPDGDPYANSCSAYPWVLEP
jgi:hypothetical protein